MPWLFTLSHRDIYSVIIAHQENYVTKMTKSNFLLVDLNEPKTKKLAETITSDTSRKILNYLAEQEDAEANIAKMLGIPISTTHYHLQKLQEAGLVTAKEFHYSQKGREVNHYKLANKYIIIAPQKTEGLREKLKGILPVAGIVLGISAVIKIVQTLTAKSMFGAETKVAAAADTMMESTALAAPLLAKEAPLTSQPDIALWFLIGSAVTIALYAFYVWIKEKWWK